MLSGLSQVSDAFTAVNMVRGSGMAAYILLFLIVAGGLLLSVKLVPARRRAVFLSYHRFITAATVILLLIHGAAFFISQYQYLSWADVLIPFWTQRHTWEIAAGIIAVYTMGVLFMTSLRSVMKTIGWGKWRITHYLAFPCYWIALYHSIALGKSNNALFLNYLYPATASIIIALTVLRIWKTVERRKTANENSAGGR